MIHMQHECKSVFACKKPLLYPARQPCYAPLMQTLFAAIAHSLMPGAKQLSNQPAILSFWSSYGLCNYILRYIFWGFKLAAPIFLLLLVIIVSCGQVVGRRESWSRLDALYWSFIAALTVGYDDFVPVKKNIPVPFCADSFLRHYLHRYRGCCRHQSDNGCIGATR